MKPASTQTFQKEAKTDQLVPLFAYELLRDILIPEMLGNDTDEISYWVGKHIARTFPLLSNEEISSFFKEAAWGDLELVEQNKKEMKLELTGDIVERRLLMHNEPSFRLEAGFIAEQIQSQKNLVTEAHEEIAKKKKKVFFIVRWDLKDPVQS
ncbi:YslB family protein [Lederbergia ruris]|uniref:YslB family protein n=1 Tax=Lederbergia ruris TaxID=217495 RepID=UPI00399F585D